MTNISPHLIGLLRAIKHPIRLPILLALVQEEAGATELARRFDVTFDTVNHALAELRKAGYIELVRVEPIIGSSLERRIYRSVRSDWPQLVEDLEDFAGGDPAESGDA
jgi:DNA-binding transcriptional ArsR family regulator